MNTDDLIYAAGYIDGEGCITTTGNGGFRLTISSVDKDILIWFQETFGGNVNNQYLPANINHNMAWKWVLCRKKELNILLKALLPYFKLKHSQAAVVISFLDIYGVSHGGVKSSSEELDAYLKTKVLLKSFKTDKHVR